MVVRRLFAGRARRWALALILVLVSVAFGPWLAFRLVELALVPLLLLWVPYLKVLPALYDFRMRRLLTRHYVALAEVEGALENATDAVERLRHLRALEDLPSTLRPLTDKLPASMR